MKRTQLLNRHLSLLVAELGHLDEITVADAGLPVPGGVRVIDLAISPGAPKMAIVLRALAAELVLDGAIIAGQANGHKAESILKDALAGFAVSGGSRTILPQQMDHEDFKARTGQSKAVIRTGEITPYCNIILMPARFFAGGFFLKENRDKQHSFGAGHQQPALRRNAGTIYFCCRAVTRGIFLARGGAAR